MEFGACDFAGVVLGHHDGVGVDAGLLQFKDALTTISSVLEGWNASDPSPCFEAASIARPLAVCRR